MKQAIRTTILLIALLLPVAAFGHDYHVRLSKTTNRWRVEWDGHSMGYQAWDKRVALSAAKEMAKQNKPSRVVVHDRQGNVLQVIPYATRKGRKP